MSYRSENTYQSTSRTLDALNSFRPEYPDDVEDMEKTQVDAFRKSGRLSSRRETARTSESYDIAASARIGDEQGATFGFDPTKNKNSSRLLTGRDSLLGTVRNIKTSRVEATLRALQMEKIELAKRLRGVERDLLIANNNEMAIQKMNKKKKMRPVPSYMQPTTARSSKEQAANKKVVGDPLDMKRMNKTKEVIGRQTLFN